MMVLLHAEAYDTASEHLPAGRPLHFKKILRGSTSSVSLLV